MERVIGPKEVGANLASLLEEVEKGGRLILVRRGRKAGVLLSYEEYTRLKTQAEEGQRRRLAAQLTLFQKRAQEAGLREEEVEQAIRQVRGAGRP